MPSLSSPALLQKRIFTAVTFSSLGRVIVTLQSRNAAYGKDAAIIRALAMNETRLQSTVDLAAVRYVENVHFLTET